MTHGKGKKGGRGSGLRGGRGNSGLHKHRFSYMLKYMPDHFGVHGFKRDSSLIKTNRIINIGQLDERFKGKKEIDLSKEGYDKLLGGGIVEHGYKITVKFASQKAIDKIAEHGGEVKIEK